MTHATHNLLRLLFMDKGQFQVTLEIDGKTRTLSCCKTKKERKKKKEKNKKENRA